MAYKIIDTCTACTACLQECQNSAISEGDPIYVIDPDKCTECVGNYPNPKCAEVCMLEACLPDPTHRESKEQLLAKWHRLHPDKEPVPGTY